MFKLINCKATKNVILEACPAAGQGILLNLKKSAGNKKDSFGMTVFEDVYSFLKGQLS
jgi:hypothetical protein